MTLSQLADKHKTDKGPNHHNYTAIYERYLEPLRNSPQTLLELGVGGYEFPERGGESLRMWVEYCNGNWYVIGTDLHKKDFIVEGAAIHQMGQTEALPLISLCGAMPPSIIIDDASHINPLTIRSFEILWPILQPGGLYIVEDTETSYWGVIHTGEDYGGGVGKGIIAYMQAKTIPMDLDKDSDIEYIHFYKGLIIIKKK
jgi:hypothetical protein